ncbi:MAG: hypothetical protein JW954_00910 [Dehalococcoidaceae bacterium]|nr:hypothetical protein [Dehalococcoidaceae bacterium]
MPKLSAACRMRIGMILGLVLVFSGLGGCDTASPLPAFREMPPALDLDKLIGELQADPQAAAAKYGDRYYLFVSVPAEKVVSLRTTSAGTKGPHYLESGLVRFLPEYTRNLDNVGPGFVVDIVGQVTDWTWDKFFIINNCTFIVSVGGDLPQSSY